MANFVYLCTATVYFEGKFDFFFEKIKMFAVFTYKPMNIIVLPNQYIRMKHSKTSHAKCVL